MTLAGPMSSELDNPYPSCPCQLQISDYVIQEPFKLLPPGAEGLKPPGLSDGVPEVSHLWGHGYLLSEFIIDHCI